LTTDLFFLAALSIDPSAQVDNSEAHLEDLKTPALKKNAKTVS